MRDLGGGFVKTSGFEKTVVAMSHIMKNMEEAMWDNKSLCVLISYDAEALDTYIEYFDLTGGAEGNFQEAANIQRYHRGPRSQRHRDALRKTLGALCEIYEKLFGEVPRIQVETGQTNQSNNASET